MKGVQTAHSDTTKDGKDIANNQAANQAKEVASKEAEVSHSANFNFNFVDDLNLHVHENSNFAKCSNSSHHNVSPKGTGDCSLDDIILLQKEVGQKGDLEHEEDDLNLFIDLSSQLNAEHVEFSKGKSKKGY